MRSASFTKYPAAWEDPIVLSLARSVIHEASMVGYAEVSKDKLRRVHVEVLEAHREELVDRVRNALQKHYFYGFQPHELTEIADAEVTAFFGTITEP